MRPRRTTTASSGESVELPAKVMRIGSMIKQLLEEVRSAPLDEAGREPAEGDLRAVGGAAGRDAVARPARASWPASPRRSTTGTPSEAELRVAQAQLVGWLEGLFHGIQATLFAQQMAARQQLEQMRGQLPPGAQARPTGDAESTSPGTYL